MTPHPPPGNFLGVATVGVSPVSRGSVRLRSSDPFEHPLIDPGILNHPFDKVVMREAVKSLLKFLAAPAWSDYVIGPVGDLAAAVNATDVDAALDEYIQANTGTSWHPTGSASMSPAGAENGVVDPDLRVKNVTGLRIVDASILVSLSPPRCAS